VIHLLMIYVTVPDDFESATATVDDLVEKFEVAVQAAIPAASVNVDDWETTLDEEL